MQRGRLDLEPAALAFLGKAPAPYLLTALAIGELVGDKLPRAPRRTAPGPFLARVGLGALCGAALAVGAKRTAAAGAWLGGLGAVAGTLGGYEARTRSVQALHVPDLPIALIEDAAAIGGSLFLVRDEES